MTSLGISLGGGDSIELLVRWMNDKGEYEKANLYLMVPERERDGHPRRLVATYKTLTDEEVTLLECFSGEGVIRKTFVENPPIKRVLLRQGTVVRLNGFPVELVNDASVLTATPSEILLDNANEPKMDNPYVGKPKITNGTIPR